MMIQKFSLLSTCAILFFSLFIATETRAAPVSLILDNKNINTLPSSFRSTEQAKNNDVAKLNISGSAQFSGKGFSLLLKKLPTRNVVVVDLREESHGLIDGYPVSWVLKGNNKNWANEGKTLSEIEQDEVTRLFQTEQEGVVSLKFHNNFYQRIVVQSASTEKLLVESSGIKYLRLPVTDNHKPTPETVDRFVNFVKLLPPNTWLHFHCRAGKGRTTTFMVLYDIIRNGQNTKLKKIIKRQHDLGGSNLFNLHDADDPDHENLAERLEFIKKFYQYRREVPDLSTPFSKF